MKPAIIDLTVYQGSTFNKNFQWLSGTDPTNLTNCSIRMQVRQSLFGDVITEFSTSTSGLTITDAVLGKFKLTIAASVSSLFTSNKYIYDIEITFPDSSVYRVIKGSILIDQEVTR